MIPNNSVVHGKCEDRLVDLQDSSVDLVVLDPPYFRILKEKWDQFANLDAYLQWSEKYLSIITNKTRINGTLVLFGCSRSFNVLCHLNKILESMGFLFIQEIVLDKGMKSMAGRMPANMKMFPSVAENILIYRKNYNPFIKTLLKTHQLSSGLTNKDVMKYLGQKDTGSGIWCKYTGNTEFPQFPTREHWAKLSELFSIDIEYDSIKETYNSIRGLTNVWSDISFREQERFHPAQKPVVLMDRIIRTYSDENNLVLDPFSGSGTTLVVSKSLNRNYIGIENDKEYYDKILNRLLVD